MAESAGGRCSWWNPGPRTKSLIFWMFSLFALLITGASTASSGSTPWATFAVKNGTGELGLWKLYGCVDGVCVSEDYPLKDQNPCYKYGIGAGVILIIVMVFHILTWLARGCVMCSKDHRWVRTFKAFMILKPIFQIVGPAVAIGIWTDKCYNFAEPSSPTWSVGPGILILAMIFEIFALYGFRSAWEGGAGEGTGGTTTNTHP